MRPRRLLVAFLAAMVVLVGAPSAAGGPLPDDGDIVLGTVGGVRYAADEATYDAFGTASEFTGCGPSGHVPIGGGTDAQGPLGEAWISTTIPFGAWHSRATGPPGGSMVGYSICVDDDVPVRTKYRDDPPQPNRRRIARASCAIPGWDVAGGGGALYSPDSWLSASYPVDGKDPDHVRDDGWLVKGWDWTGGTGTFEAHVICVREGHVRTVRREPIGAPAGSEMTARVACPDDAHVTGGGAAITGPQDRGRLVSTIPYDGDDADEIPDDGWQVTVDNVAGGDKRVRAFAICFS